MSTGRPACYFIHASLACRKRNCQRPQITLTALLRKVGIYRLYEILRAPRARKSLDQRSPSQRSGYPWPAFRRATSPTAPTARAAGVRGPCGRSVDQSPIRRAGSWSSLGRGASCATPVWRPRWSISLRQRAVSRELRPAAPLSRHRVRPLHRLDMRHAARAEHERVAGEARGSRPHATRDEDFVARPGGGGFIFGGPLGTVFLSEEGSSPAKCLVPA